MPAILTKQTKRFFHAVLVLFSCLVFTHCGVSADPDLAVTVGVSPANIVVSPGASQSFQATETSTRKSTGAIVVTSDVSAFDWTILEGRDGGDLDADTGTTTRFVYTAPSAPGTYHLVIADKQDSSQVATALIIVK